MHWRARRAMKNIIIAILVMLLLVGTPAIVIFVFSSVIYDTSDHLIDIQKEIRNTEARERTIGDLEKVLGDIDEYTAAIDGVFVDERSLVAVIETFEKTAEMFGLRAAIEHVSLPTSEHSQGPEFQIRLEGDFDALYRFIRTLEVMPFQFSFSSIDMSKNPTEDPSKNVWRATLRLLLLSFISQS